jgi:putative nucleotidyltransferase-like protein
MSIESKEFGLLCACSGVAIGPERASHIAQLTAAELDWKEFLRLAEAHGVLPLVARNLGSYSESIPEEVRQSIQQAVDENAKRNLWFSSELARILERLEARKLRTIPYKGPVLSELVYGDLSLRNFTDLDFLISRIDFESARLALAELGYQPSEALTPAVERFWLVKGYERAFDGKAGKYLVELQWALLPYFFAVDLPVEGLLARSTYAVAGGRNVSCLSPEDSLLVLCLHGAKHLWSRLIWVCDIAESLRAQKIDHSVLAARARSLGILRIVRVNLWLAANLLGAELSPPFREILAGDSEISALGKIFLSRMASGAPHDFESAEYFLLTSKLRERRADRLRFFWRLVWTPGVGDLAAIRLPESLFPLYRLVRLGRLAGKLVRH